MVTGPALSLPPFQLDWEGTHEDLHRGGRFCLSDSSSLASPGVVLAGVEDVGGEPGPSPHGAGSTPESSFESSPPNTGESDVFNRMACLRQGFLSQDFSERVTELLLQSWRSNTHSAYNSAWSKWCGWCSGRHINPLSASLGNILEFLADQFDLGLQYCFLNTLRSAISNSHSQIDSVNVGSHPIVSRLLKGMFIARPPAPRYSGSWDVAIVVEYLRSCPSESLLILELGKKVVTLMALANASRCSDLAALDRDYLRWTSSGAQFTVVQLTKTHTPGPPKSVHYSSLSEDAEAVRGSTALWFEHWPGNRRVPGSMPSSISCCCCCFLEQETLLSLLQSTQLYKWVNLSHQYCKEFGNLLGDILKEQYMVRRDLPGVRTTIKKKKKKYVQFLPFGYTFLKQQTEQLQ